MEIYLLRHAIAEEQDPTKKDQDNLRRLTSEGIKKMNRGAIGMKSQGLTFDLILSSPYLRAKETAEIVARTLKLSKVVRYSAALAPMSSPKKLVAEILESHSRHKSVLLVGHEPHLGRLATLLLTGESGNIVRFKKGGLCKLAIVDELQTGKCAVLDFLATPRQMREW